MQAFIVESANKPGELARITSAIAQRGINLYVYSLGLGSRGGSAILATDEAGVKNALTGAGIEYREIPVLTISLEDKPGTAAATAKKLADAGVNIELFAPVQSSEGKVTIVLGVDKIADAQKLLADQFIEWKVPERAQVGVSSI